MESVSSDKNTFFNAIVDERAWELGCELVRRYDLVRWNILGQKLDEMKSDIMKIINDDPEFNWIPNRIYWKQGDDGETLDIFNPDFRWTGKAPESYSSTAWGAGLSARDKERVVNYLDQCASGYNKDLNNHLQPLTLEIMNASRGVLTNDQIP